MTELIILGTLLRVGENVVCLVYLLELGFSLRIIRIEVRVILLGKLTVGFLYFIIGRTFLQAEHFIIISFFCHNNLTFPTELSAVF